MRPSTVLAMSDSISVSRVFALSRTDLAIARLFSILKIQASCLAMLALKDCGPSPKPLRASRISFRSSFCSWSNTATAGLDEARVFACFTRKRESLASVSAIISAGVLRGLLILKLYLFGFGVSRTTIENGDEGGNRTPYYAYPNPRRAGAAPNELQFHRANGFTRIVAIHSSAKSQRHNVKGEEGLDPTIVYALCGVREYVPLLSGVYGIRICSACQAYVPCVSCFFEGFLWL